MALASSVLALVASIVLPAVGGTLVAPLGLAAPLAPGRLAAAAGPVGMTPVTSAADGEGPLAAPAMAQVKDSRRLGLGHRSLQR